MYRTPVAHNLSAMPAIVDLTELLHIDDIHFNFQTVSVIEAIPLLLRPAIMRRLDDSVLAALQAWRWKPGTRGQFDIPITFTLSRDPNSGKRPVGSSRLPKSPR